MHQTVAAAFCFRQSNIGPVTLNQILFSILALSGQRYYIDCMEPRSSQGVGTPKGGKNARRENIALDHEYQR